MSEENINELNETTNEIETLQAEKMAKYNEYNDLLKQMDYTARKVAFEVAKALKTKFPDIKLPNYEKYKEGEAKAEEFRQILNDLEENS